MFPARLRGVLSFEHGAEMTTNPEILAARVRRAEEAEAEAVQRARERTYEALVALVEAVGPTEAARLLGVSRQALAQRLSRLSR